MVNHCRNLYYAIYLALKVLKNIEYIIPHEQAVTTIESKIPSKKKY
jgi:hypothetical protein